MIFPEKGYAFPGALIFGTDSHTVTNSALGCLATGLGHSDIASYLALGYNWLRVPEVIRFNLHGEFKLGVCAKDIALRIAQLYGEDAAPYLAVEFSGSLTAKLPMSERLVLCNMVIDFGAKTGYIQPDETTARFIAQRAPQLHWTAATTDLDSDCGRIVDLDVGAIDTLVAVPHDLSDIRSAGTLSDVRIDEAIFGTCTGGRIEDFRVAASIMKGKKLAPHTRMMVNPGSREVYPAGDARRHHRRPGRGRRDQSACPAAGLAPAATRACWRRPRMRSPMPAVTSGDVSEAPRRTPMWRRRHRRGLRDRRLHRCAGRIHPALRSPHALQGTRPGSSVAM